MTTDFIKTILMRHGVEDRNADSIIHEVIVRAAAQNEKELVQILVRPENVKPNTNQRAQQMADKIGMDVEVTETVKPNTNHVNRRQKQWSDEDAKWRGQLDERLSDLEKFLVSSTLEINVDEKATSRLIARVTKTDGEASE